MADPSPAASLASLFLDSARDRFAALRRMAERALEQVEDADLFWSPDPESNSIAILLQHVSGNLISRWTEFLTSDGEKPWRDRDREFVSDPGAGRGELMKRWAEGWECLSRALAGLSAADLEKQVVIRGESLTVIDAIHRQLAHYASHIGQIVFLAKHRRGPAWRTLSIARGRSCDLLPPARS
jgi:hypothetical protein